MRIETDELSQPDALVQECELQASDDPALYTEAQCQRLLNSIHAGNKAHGGLSLVLEVALNFLPSLCILSVAFPDVRQVPGAVL